jgi:hypothetical protein
MRHDPGFERQAEEFYLMEERGSTKKNRKVICLQMITSGIQLSFIQASQCDKNFLAIEKFMRILKVCV